MMHWLLDEGPAHSCCKILLHTHPSVGRKSFDGSSFGRYLAICGFGGRFASLFYVHMSIDIH